ncbi:hypothetical protein H0H93_013427 [Arthromyces matolae]|nr:hypothetical protein H0H93_013427 [Arthromyces matolae]
MVLMPNSMLNAHSGPAYVEVVPGDARTQARIRQFCFNGLVRWKLGTIIEGLPLILHGSVAIFLIGLSLYVAQISRPICAILSLMTAVAFIFYLGTSMIPVFSIDCPFRLSSMFIVARLLLIISRSILRVLYNYVAWKFPSLGYRSLEFFLVFPGFLAFPPLETLRKEEYDRSAGSLLMDWRSLSWLFGHTTNNSTKDMVLEGVTGALDQIKDTPSKKPVLEKAVAGLLLLGVLVYAANRQSDLEERSNSGDITLSVWKVFTTKFLMIGEYCRRLMNRYRMDGIGTIGHYIIKKGNQDDVDYAMHKGSKELGRLGLNFDRGMKDAASCGNLEVSQDKSSWDRFRLA